MPNDDLFAVEETSASQTAAPAADSTPSEPTPAIPQTPAIETDLTPTAEQQDTLNRIRDASSRTGTFQLQNGRVVVAKSAGTPTAPQNAQPQTPAQPAQTPEQSEQMVELNWRGQLVQKPISEVRNLAQKGFDYEAKSFELNQQRQELNQMMQAVQELTANRPPVQQVQPVQPEPMEINEAEIAQQALAAVKAKYGKDDPDFEFDPLSPEQAAAYNLATVELARRVLTERDTRQAQENQRKATELRLSSWENQQRSSDPQYGEVVGWVTEQVGTDFAGKPIPRLKQLLTAEQYSAADEALRTGDVATLSKVVNYCKVKFQQQKLGLPTKPQTVTPPVVQAPGNGQPSQSQQSATKAWPKSEHNIPQEQRIELWKQRFAPRR